MTHRKKWVCYLRDAFKSQETPRIIGKFQNLREKEKLSPIAIGEREFINTWILAF